MNFKEYQEKAIQTAIYPDSANIIYPALGLVNEAGEVAGKIKKMIRDDNFVLTDERLISIEAELGDVLWYLAAICRDLGISLEDVAKENIRKLLARKLRGTLKGDGDSR